MSTEVECHDYLHRPNKNKASENDRGEVDYNAWMTKSTNRWKAKPVKSEGPSAGNAADAGATSEPSASSKRMKMVQLPRRNVFRHNPLHDLESVLWVSVWVTVCSTFVKNNLQTTDEEWNRYLEHHGVFARQLFCDPSFRRSAMSSSPNLLAGFVGLIPELSWVALQLDKIKTSLLTRYEEAEERLDDPDYQIGFGKIARNLHNDMVELFDAIADELHDDDLKIDVQAQTQKRKQMQNLITARSSKDPQDSDDRPRKVQKRYPGDIAPSASAVSLDRSSRVVRA